MTEKCFAVENPIVSKYVRSLYEISVTLGMEERTSRQLESIRDCILSLDDHEKYLTKISLISKLGEGFVSLLKKELKLSKEVGNFLSLLLKNKRLPLLPSICDGYFSFVDKVNGRKVFFVTYAKTFTKTAEKQLISNLQEVFGGKIECIASKDPSLIDGIKIRFRSKILDYSMKSKLMRLKCAIRGENYEN
jgi:F-type H+-transporting ATPase subunit delta